MKRTAILAATLLALVGCTDDKSLPAKAWAPTMTNPPVVEVKDGKPMTVPEMKPDDVVVAVNGVALTKREVDVRLNRYRWFLSRNRGMEQQQKTSMYRHYGKTLVNDFINTQVIAWESRAVGGVDEATVRREVERSVEKTLKQNNLTRDFYERHVPGGIAATAKSLEDAFWVHVYLTNNIVIDPEINASLYSNIVKQIDAENAVIAASNRVLRTKIEKALKRVKEGKEDFGKVADEVSEDILLERDGTGYYGVFNENTILNEDHRKVLFALSEGDVSGILDEDDGWSIYKVLVSKPAKFKGKDIVEDAEITLARIFVAKEELIQPAFSANPVEDLRNSDFKKKTDRLVGQLRQKAQIAYPHGTNFWNTATGEKKPVVRK